MEIKEAIEIIQEYEREHDIDKLQEELEEKESELEDLASEISDIQGEIDMCKVSNLDDDDEVKKAYEVIEDGWAEAQRIEDAIKSGVVKNTRLVEIQLKEFIEQLQTAKI